MNQQDKKVQALQASSNNCFFTSYRGGRGRGKSMSNSNGRFSNKTFANKHILPILREGEEVMTTIIQEFASHK
jgi:hypothetical protein